MFAQFKDYKPRKNNVTLENYDRKLQQAKAISSQRPGIEIDRFLRTLGYRIGVNSKRSRFANRRYWSQRVSKLISKLENDGAIVCQKTYPFVRGALYQIYPPNANPPISLIGSSSQAASISRPRKDSTRSIGLPLPTERIAAESIVLQVLEPDGQYLTLPEIETRIINEGLHRPSFNRLRMICVWLVAIGVLTRRFRGMKYEFRVLQAEEKTFDTGSYIVEFPLRKSERWGIVEAVLPADDRGISRLIVRWDDEKHGVSFTSSELSFAVVDEAVDRVKSLLAPKTRRTKPAKKITLCPHCGSHAQKNGKWKNTQRQSYLCPACRRQFIEGANR